MVGDVAGDRDLVEACAAMPARLRAALALDWSQWGESLVQARPELLPSLHTYFTTHADAIRLVCPPVSTSL